MLKLFKIIFPVICLFFSFNIALAQEETEDVIEEGTGIQADSPLYFLDTAADKLKLALTLNKEKKGPEGLEPSI